MRFINLLSQSKRSGQLTDQAASLAALLGARLVVMHVAELPPGVSAPAYLTADTLERLGPFAEAARGLGAQVEIQVTFGAIVPSILDAAAASRADLIVIGTHGRTGLARIVLGSVAEGVAHKAHVPVMLVRRESRPECARASCEWCPHEGRSPAERRLAGETNG